MRLTVEQLRAIKNRPATKRIFPAAVIGIDPGTNTGLAVLGRANDPRALSGSPVGEGWLLVKTFDFWEAHDLILLKYPPAETVLVIENGGLNKITFQTAKVDGLSPERARRAQDRVSRNVGAANEHSKLLIARFKSFGYYVVELQPVKAKLSAIQTKQLTQYAGQTNSHERDALRLAYEQRHLLRIQGGIEYRL